MGSVMWNEVREGKWMVTKVENGGFGQKRGFLNVSSLNEPKGEDLRLK